MRLLVRARTSLVLKDLVFFVVVQITHIGFISLSMLRTESSQLQVRVPSSVFQPEPHELHVTNKLRNDRNLSYILPS